MAAILLDFDGTIADSFDFVVGFLEKHVRRGRLLEPHEKDKLRGMTMQEMATHLGCPKWKLPLLFLIGRYSMGRIIYNVPLFEGMGKVIEQLHAEGHEPIIVSSNNVRNIKKFLKQHHLHKYFVDIYGNAGFFGKERAIRRTLARNHVAQKDAVYIGDESRDVIGAHGAEVRVIAVTWGFDRADLLASHNPTALAGKPQDIITILEEI